MDRLSRITAYIILGVIIAQVIFTDAVLVIYLVKNGWRF